MRMWLFFGSNQAGWLRSSFAGGFLLFASEIDASTLPAYQETERRVLADPQFMLRVGGHQRDLAALDEISGVTGGYFITVWYPSSLASTRAQNTGYQPELARELFAHQLDFRKGVTQHPSNQWPGKLIIDVGIGALRSSLIGNRPSDSLSSTKFGCDFKALPESGIRDGGSRSSGRGSVFSKDVGATRPGL